MFSKFVYIAVILSSAASAAPVLHAHQNACQDAYEACIAAGTAEFACSCTLTACRGEDTARIRTWCASATINLSMPTSSDVPVTTSIPDGCNLAHPGSFLSSYFDNTTVLLVPTSISGGCNPDHSGSCLSSYLDTITNATVATTTSIQNTSTAVVTPVASVAPPVLVEGKSWTIANLTRYCTEGNSGCDYHFAVTIDGETERCNVIRLPGSNAATESWANKRCTTGSSLNISWGYVAEPAPAFAVITVVKGEELAWFGVPDINGGKVTPSSPFGSRDFGTLPAAPVYTYK
jgi:hypothetical protein